jgi:hypothetical protein
MKFISVKPLIIERRMAPSRTTSNSSTHSVLDHKKSNFVQTNGARRRVSFNEDDNKYYANKQVTRDQCRETWYSGLQMKEFKAEVCQLARRIIQSEKQNEDQSRGLSLLWNHTLSFAKPSRSPILSTSWRTTLSPSLPNWSAWRSGSCAPSSRIALPGEGASRKRFVNSKASISRNPPPVIRRSAKPVAKSAHQDGYTLTMSLIWHGKYKKNHEITHTHTHTPIYPQITTADSICSGRPFASVQMFAYLLKRV